MILAPIGLFVYNRPEHTRKTVEALKKNDLANECNIIIYSDGAKNLDQTEGVAEVRKYLKTIDGFKSVKVIEQKRNLGLANSIIEGVTSIVNKYGRIIVLEDDLIVTPQFLEYMNLALEKYESESKVIQISGYMFPVRLQIKEDALFLPLTTSWGWATWARAWNFFDPDAKGYALVNSDLSLRKRFNLDGAYNYFSMLEAQLAGDVDSWAIRWQLTAFLNEALTLYPKQSLIENIGFDGSGTHGANNGLTSNFRTSLEFLPTKFPIEIKVSDSWTDIRDYLKSQWKFWGKFKRKVCYFISRIINFGNMVE